MTFTIALTWHGVLVALEWIVGLGVYGAICAILGMVSIAPTWR